MFSTFPTAFHRARFAAIACIVALAAFFVPSLLFAQIPGSLDTNFASGTGKIANLAIGPSRDSAYAVVLQHDGKLVLAGRCSNGSNDDFCIARLHLDGSLDLSFDGPSGFGNGVILFPMGTGADVARALAIQPDGKIVLAGVCDNDSNRDFCIARLNGGSAGARNCTLDFDGDGVVQATTDMLIGTRVALGMRGPSVINGINLSGKPRDTWDKVRDYLVAQCGMSVY
jgi:uncharacterized delta-60 repeat protein